MPKPIPDGLYTRELIQFDIPSLTKTLMSAPDDGTFYRFPDVLHQPNLWEPLYISWLRHSILDTYILTRVALMPNKKTGRDEVVGFSSWSHYVADLEHPHKTIRQRWRNPSVFDFINSSLMNLESRYKSIITKLRPNQVPRLKSIAERSAALSKCRVKIPSPAERTPCYELNGMAVHVDWQGHGIASLLVQWGLDRATEENVPVFVAGEERGISFYQNALGFVRLPKSEYWLDRDAHEISREDVVDGNEDWKRQNDGVAGAYAVWCPDNVIVDADGCLITPYSSP